MLDIPPVFFPGLWAAWFSSMIEIIPDTGVASLQQLPDLGTGVAEIFTNVSS